jgi:glycosyltransferase involved in cell wall biosynthesis
MKISVIVPCFNSQLFLDRCLKALFTQTLPRDRYEVIFIDNRSTDLSLEIAKSFPELIILEEEIQSSYAARTRGVRQAKGEILAFTDSDCEACSEWLEQASSALAEPGTTLVLGGVRNARESFPLRMTADYEAQRAEYVWTQPNKRLHYGHTGNMVMHREVFERCGPFLQVARGADTVFVSRVVETYGSESVRYVRQAQVRHLEIDCVADWLRKLSTYGRSYDGYHAWSGTRALGFGERWEVMRRTIAHNRYSWALALSLAVLLAIGVIPFELSRLLQSMRRRTITAAPQ